MAKIQNVKEKLHAPLYDAFFVPGTRNGTAAKTFGEMMTDPRALRFFVDVQNKTRLETNMQAAGVLPSLNTFEARAMRVVASSLVEGATTGSPPLFQPSEPSFLAELIYNSVTTLLVGEKIMIEMPTFYFPAGAGITGAFQAGIVTVSNHGDPDPLATFRFAEPVFIEPQQNFRVEMLFPQGVPDAVSKSIGPIRLWVVLDGYLTRDVQ
jgi:hypothetical protein